MVSLPGFVIKVATQDYHPASHVSFAMNHPPPNNKPFERVIAMKNWVPGREHEMVEQRLWPVHCVQGTKGADFVDEFAQDKLDVVVRKGMDERTEMYSVFADAFGNFDCAGTGVSHDVVELLKAKKVSHVFVLGLAGDYCVKYTALDAVKAGFAAYIIEDGIKCVDQGQGWRDTAQEFERAGVRVVRADGAEVSKVKALTRT